MELRKGLLPRFLIVTVCLLGGLISMVRGQQAQYPPLPDKFDVQIRYRIESSPDGRYNDYKTMTEFFKKLGFVATPRPDADLDALDSRVNMLPGTITAENAGKILEDQRVQTILIAPAGFKLPDGDGKKVKVLLLLQTGLSAREQQMLFEQTREIILKQGFEEDIAYDTRGYTRLRGLMPTAVVPGLIQDIRQQSTGWFLPEKLNRELPYPIREVLPIRIVRILREADSAVWPASELPPLPAPQFVKLSADLRRALAADGGGNQPGRVEVVLDRQPTERLPEVRQIVKFFNPPPFIEGSFGDIVTLKLEQLSQAGELAKVPIVAHIRFPLTVVPAAQPVPPPVPKEKDKDKDDKLGANSTSSVKTTSFQAPFDIFRATRLNRLHENGRKGAGIRVVLIAEDFSGVGPYLTKGLPAGTTILDLTALHNATVLPDPAKEEGIGAGTQEALAMAMAAPEARLTLVRVDRSSPYMLLDAAKYIKGDGSYVSEGVRTLRERLEFETQSASQARAKALEEYRNAFDDFSEEEGPRKRRADAQAGVKATEEKQKDLYERGQRLIAFEKKLSELAGVQVVVNTMGWQTGYALDGLSPLSRYLGEYYLKNSPPMILNGAKQPKTPLWFQAAGDVRGQSWSGHFRDIDGNGAMEFAPPTAPIPEAKWTRELNFLAYRPFGQSARAELPAGTVKVTLQWREPHDHNFPVDDYLDPLATLKLIMLRQIDPNAEKVSNDEFEIVAQSEGPAEPIRILPRYGIYERSFVVNLPSAGRFALRLEGQIPASLKPIAAPTLETANTEWSLQPRIFLESLDHAGRAGGQVIFADYPAQLGGVSIPADSRGAISVGAANSDGSSVTNSSRGAGGGLELLVKPDLLMYDVIPNLPGKPARGTPIATAFAGGMAATMLSAGAQQSGFLPALRIAPGGYFEVPEFWFKK